MKAFLLMVLVMVVSGCAATEVKAPCDYQGHFCGKKIPINASY